MIAKKCMGKQLLQKGTNVEQVKDTNKCSLGIVKATADLDFSCNPMNISSCG